MTHSHQRLSAAAAIGLSLVAVSSCSTDARNDASTVTAAAPSPPIATPATTSNAEPSKGTPGRSYNDGTYRAKGWYGGLPSSIDVELTLNDDVITTVDVTPNATDPTSLEYQTSFAEAVPDVVVGKRIDQVRLSRVAGSSGTPIGFNDALQKIRNQAAE